MRASIFYMINSTPSLKQEGAALAVVVVAGNPNSANPLPLPQQLLFPRVHTIVQDGLNMGREAQSTPLLCICYNTVRASLHAKLPGPDGCADTLLLQNPADSQEPTPACASAATTCRCIPRPYPTEVGT